LCSQTRKNSFPEYAYLPHRFPSKKLQSLSLAEKYSSPITEPENSFRFRKGPPSVEPILSHYDPLRIVVLQLSKIHFSNILPATTRSPNRFCYKEILPLATRCTMIHELVPTCHPIPCSASVNVSLIIISELAISVVDWMQVLSNVKGQIS
jgi:hypothetical protein